MMTWLLSVLHFFIKLSKSISGEVVWISTIILLFANSIDWLAYVLIVLMSLNIIDAVLFNKELQKEVLDMWKSNPVKSGVAGEIEDIIENGKKK